MGELMGMIIRIFNIEWSEDPIHEYYLRDTTTLPKEVIWTEEQIPILAQFAQYKWRVIRILVNEFGHQIKNFDYEWVS